MTASIKSVWNSRSTFIKLSENPLYYGQTRGGGMSKIAEISNRHEKKYGIPMSSIPF